MMDVAVVDVLDGDFVTLGVVTTVLFGVFEADLLLVIIGDEIGDVDEDVESDDVGVFIVVSFFSLIEFGVCCCCSLRFARSINVMLFTFASSSSFAALVLGLFGDSIKSSSSSSLSSSTSSSSSSSSSSSL